MVPRRRPGSLEHGGDLVGGDTDILSDRREVPPSLLPQRPDRNNSSTSAADGRAPLHLRTRRPPGFSTRQYSEKPARRVSFQSGPSSPYLVRMKAVEGLARTMCG